MASGGSDSVHTDSSASSERTEAESISTEESCYGESSVAWIKPQVPNQLPSHLHTQHVKSDNPELWQIACCCDGPLSSTVTTTDIPCKDPRTHVSEDTHPVIMVKGQMYSLLDSLKNFSLHPVHGVWVSSLLTKTTRVSEDPEWIRRRVVAVEQQQWNHYHAASAKSEPLASHFEPFVLPKFSFSHIQREISCVIPEYDCVSHETDITAGSEDADAGAKTSCSLSTFIGIPSLRVCTSEHLSLETLEENRDRGVGSLELVVEPSSPPTTSEELTNCNYQIFPETLAELASPSVELIQVPEEFRTDVKPDAEVVSELGSSFYDKNLDCATSKTSQIYPDD